MILMIKLEFIPDLTPEEKEAQELKAEKALDQDTEVAIKQSLDYCATYQQLKNCKAQPRHALLGYPFHNMAAHTEATPTREGI